MTFNEQSAVDIKRIIHRNGSALLYFNPLFETSLIFQTMYAKKKVMSTWSHVNTADILQMFCLQLLYDLYISDLRRKRHFTHLTSN